MPTRRQFLSQATTVGLAALAGCSFPGGQSSKSTSGEQMDALTDVSVTTNNATCEDVNSGKIHVDGEQLTVTGELVAPNECYDAHISGLKVTDEVNRLLIYISPTKPDDYDECKQSTNTDCIAGVEYEASATLSRDFDRIVVAHKTGELTEVVARYTAPISDGTSTTDGN